MSATWDRQLDPETEARIDAHLDEVMADWPPLTDRQRDAVRNAFRRSPAEQDTTSAA